ncbi:uncharacterized protein LOC117333754 [Pecten maximus]|uniref:uncharacterized protein LOC117333754 n=1 Tax=Pecten maximus TaxID=6579 RepID=UPI001457F9B9|nr:uncharacterized protein LOC117333754 [Pecten maximus]
MNTDMIEEEWTRLKTTLAARRMKIQDVTWPSLEASFGNVCPMFFMLVNYLLTLPGSSVDAERGFSRMKLIKSDWRSRLGESNLSDQILLNLETEPIGSFDPMPAIAHWYSGGQRARRPFYKDEMRKSETPRECSVFQRTDGHEVIPVSLDLHEDQAEHEGEEEADEEDLQEGATFTPDSQSDDEDEDLSRRDLLALQQKSYRLFIENLRN